jgi:hypothetical protein
MATTFEIIMTNIAAGVPELTQTSNMDIFASVARAIAISLDNTNVELQNTQNIINTIIGNLRYGRSGYYTSKALAYQDGDDLVVDPITLDYIYATINTDKQIIKQAAFEISNSGSAQILSLKVARLNPDTNKLDALTSDQLAAFNTYFLNYEIPGLPIFIVSNSPNIFNFSAQIDYISTYDRSAIVSAVTAGLFDLRDNYNFNGILYINDIEAYFKSNIPGIRNMTIVNPTLDGVAITTPSVRLTSGYFDYPTGIENNMIYAAV